MQLPYLEICRWISVQRKAPSDTAENVLRIQLDLGRRQTVEPYGINAHKRLPSNDGCDLFAIIFCSLLACEFYTIAVDVHEQ